MLKKITSTPKKVKNHVVRHRAKYATVATTVVMVKLQTDAVNRFNDFLKEKGLYEEYWTIEEV